MATTFCIKDNTASNATNYEASALSKKKIQRILEMLPTMETLKKCHPLIFDNTQKCIRCDIDIENFAHIWTCPLVRHRTQLIINNAKTLLNNIIQMPLDDHSVNL